MIYVLCASMSENMESEMRYNPVCFSIKKSSHEHELVNLNASATVSNKTEITTAIPTIFFTADRKSLNYHGQTFIFNCPMPKKEHDFITQMVHWVENDKTTSLVNGKEYISCQNEEKIYIFSVETPLAKNSNTIKNYVLYALTGIAGLSVAATLGEALYKYMTTLSPQQLSELQQKQQLLKTQVEQQGKKVAELETKVAEEQKNLTSQFKNQRGFDITAVQETELQQNLKTEKAELDELKIQLDETDATVENQIERTAKDNQSTSRLAEDASKIKPVAQKYGTKAVQELDKRTEAEVEEDTEKTFEVLAQYLKSI